MAWLADRLGSAASDRILAQLERSWDCPEPELWATFLWDRQAQQLIAKRAYDLDYLGILTDWHTRHSPESVVRDCQRAYALLCGAAPTLVLEIPVLAGLGAAAVTFAATINSTLQLAVSHEMRGRVMALYSVVFLGSTPIGGPLTGWLAEAYDPRWTLVLAGISGLSAAWAARVIFTRMSERKGASARARYGDGLVTASAPRRRRRTRPGQRLANAGRFPPCSVSTCGFPRDRRRPPTDSAQKNAAPL